MRANKIAECFTTALNDLLAMGPPRAIEAGETLKSVNYILEVVAPGYGILTLHDIDGKLAGFASKHTPHTSGDQPPTPLDDDEPDGE